MNAVNVTVVESYSQKFIKITMPPCILYRVLLRQDAFVPGIVHK